MTYDEWKRKDDWLREVLADAEARGDRYLEWDVKEQLVKLRDEYYGGDEE